LEIALRTIALLQHLPEIQLYICGIGNEQQTTYYHQLANNLNIQKQIKWCGYKSNQKILSEMCEAHLFFFTSVSEDTSTVVLEAVSCQLPVLCFNACGFGNVVNEQVGIKIPLSTPQQSINDFAEKITYLFNHRDVLKQMSENCRVRQEELSWDNKAKQMVSLYKKVLSQE